MQVDAELLNSFLGSHTDTNMLDVISYRCSTNNLLDTQCGLLATFPPLGSPPSDLLGPAASPGLALCCINFELSLGKQKNAGLSTS